MVAGAAVRVAVIAVIGISSSAGRPIQPMTVGGAVFVQLDPPGSLQPGSQQGAVQFLVEVEG